MLGQNNEKIKQESNTCQQPNMCECLTSLYSNLKYCAVMHSYLTLLQGSIILNRFETTPASQVYPSRTRTANQEGAIKTLGDRVHSHSHTSAANCM